MSLENYKDKTVGEIVAHNINTAKVFSANDIDFCCHGNTSFIDACSNSNVNLEELAIQLDEANKKASAYLYDFIDWPLDLLSDYVLKTHHRNIRTNGTKILELLSKLIEVHGEKHPELRDIKQIFSMSYEDLEHHLYKEEMMLYPYIYKLFEGKLNNHAVESFHCGTVQAPINVMMHEHSEEGKRQELLEKLTNNFTAPEDGCNTFKLAYKMLKDFKEALHEHIHLENNIIFPRSLELEKKLV